MTPPHHSPYHHVEMIGLDWERHGHQGPVSGADQELLMVLEAFQNYGYRARRLQIPRHSQERSQFPGFLQRKLVNLASTSTLIILYYQGHANVDRHGHLVFTNGNGERMHWSDVVNAIIPVRCDVVTILACSHAGAAARSYISRENFEGHEKQVMMAVSSSMRAHRGSAGFAVCLEQALRDRRRNWESGFKGNLNHWAQAIDRNIAMKSGTAGHISIGRLIRQPARAAHRRIIISPRTNC